MNLEVKITGNEQDGIAESLGIADERSTHFCKLIKEGIDKEIPPAELVKMLSKECNNQNELAYVCTVFGFAVSEMTKNKIERLLGAVISEHAKDL